MRRPSAVSLHKVQRIFRAPKVRGFLVVLNAVFSDERLSWEARGVMGYLLSKPDDWRVRPQDLLRRGSAGQHKIRRILRELELTGYLQRTRSRRADGTFEWTFAIYEDPGLGHGRDAHWPGARAR